MRTRVRAARFLQLIWLLESRAYRPTELAAICGVSVRTIRRDLLELQMEPLRQPLVSERGCWRILRT